MTISLPLTKQSVLAVGLMSGTSMDGIDAALVRLTGSGEQTEVDLIKYETLSFSEELKQRIFDCCHPDTSKVDEICRLNVELGERFAEAVHHVVNTSGLQIEDLDFVSSHGQTLYHLPNESATLQIGELAVIAHKTQTLTVGDFRPSDLAVGGQGAPLVPFVDQLLFRSADTNRILLNIGGMANVTVLPARNMGSSASEEILAFDTGPGNVLIDEMVRIGSNGKQTFDQDGGLALSGTVHQAWLEQLLKRDPFVSLPYPKSTGREFYNRQMAETLWEEGIAYSLSFADVVATITQFTVSTVTMNIRSLTNQFDIGEVFVGGGGVHNQFLMKHLRVDLNRPVFSMEKLNVSSDAKEAIAFAILGNEFLRQQPNNTPSATGAKKSGINGKTSATILKDTSFCSCPHIFKINMKY